MNSFSTYLPLVVVFPPDMSRAYPLIVGTCRVEMFFPHHVGWGWAPLGVVLMDQKLTLLCGDEKYGVHFVRNGAQPLKPTIWHPETNTSGWLVCRVLQCRLVPLSVLVKDGLLRKQSLKSMAWGSWQPDFEHTIPVHLGCGTCLLPMQILGDWFHIT